MHVPDPIAAVVRALPRMALVLTPDGRILLANRAAREQLALGDERPALSDLVVDAPGALRDFLRMCSRSPEPIPGALVLRRSTGAPVAVLCKGALVSPRSAELPALLLLHLELRDPQNAFILLGQTVQELTHEVRRRRDAEAALRRSEAVLRARAADAEQASRIKDEFLAALSHELRTPLNAIVGWTDLLREGKIDPDRRARGLDVIARNARIQVQLIEELLDVSRIVTGKMRLNVRQMEPIVAIEAAIETIRPALDAKEIRLHTVLDPEAGPIAGDADRLQQIVWNLLSNAMKFTPKRGRIQVLLERVDSSIEITISDTGKGIAPEFLPHVFERFRQQEGSIARTHGGLGLGLSIVKSLVELHGGTVRAHSEGAGQGATFVIRIPRSLIRTGDAPRPFPTATAAKPASTPQSPSLDGLRILVVDDDQDSVDMLAAILEEYGATVAKCTSAAEAVPLLQSILPDLLISDIGMPREDGYALIRRVRALPRDGGGATPAIALTAFARSEDRTRALTLGFQAHLPKPVELAELLAVVASVAGRIGLGSDGP
jgi:signal transduction histidine kinase/ActR/RegA family two-component response regulator